MFWGSCAEPHKTICPRLRYLPFWLWNKVTQPQAQYGALKVGGNKVGGLPSLSGISIIYWLECPSKDGPQRAIFFPFGPQTDVKSCVEQ